MEKATTSGCQPSGMLFGQKSAGGKCLLRMSCNEEIVILHLAAGCQHHIASFQVRDFLQSATISHVGKKTRAQALARAALPLRIEQPLFHPVGHSSNRKFLSQRLSSSVPQTGILFSAKSKGSCAPKAELTIPKNLCFAAFL